MALAARSRYARQVTHPTYRFDQYSVDPATRELRSDGELVVLSPKVFDCLAWLLEHRDRAVGRDELVAAVWGKADIADTQVVQTILKARRAVGDTGEEQRVIRTIPRFGYRWIASIEMLDTETRVVEARDGIATISQAPSTSPAEVRPPPPAPRPAKPLAAVHRRTRLLGAAMIGLAIAAGGGAAWLALRHGRLPDPIARLPPAASAAVAVLPVAVGAEREWDWLRLGLMDLVTGRLREAGLAVVPSDNVISLVRDAAEVEAAERVVRQAAAPRWTVLPSVRRTAAGWTVSLELHDEVERQRMVEASAAEPAVAARQATSLLLPMLGRVDARDGVPYDDLATRVRAALLGNDFDDAQRRLDDASPSQRELPEVRVLQAQTDFGRGRFESAHARFTQLLHDVGEQADPLLRARALNGRGASSIRLIDVVAAERDFDAALGLLNDRNEPALAGQAYSGRGVARAMQGNDAGAMADFARARIALQLAGDTIALARVEMNEGALNGQHGHPTEALASFRSAAEHFERFDARSELAGALTNQIEAHLALLEPDRALEVAGRAQALVARLEDPSASRLIAYWRACALAAVGRLAEAQEQLDALIGAPDAAQDVAILAMSRNRKAALALAAGQAENAVALSRQAIANPAAGPWKDARGEAWLTLTRALRSQGKDAEAASELQQFSAWARTGADHSIALLARLAEAEQAWSDRRGEVSQIYSDALAMAEQDAVPAEIARVGVSWGTTLIAEGELEAAGAVVGRLARWASSDFSCALLQARFYRDLGQSAAWQSALTQVRALAGERAIPAAVTAEPGAAVLASGR